MSRQLARPSRKRIHISTADGGRLSAHWWAGEHARNRSAVFLSAIAAPQEYLSPFAGYLAERGWGVLTFDYRSVGESKDRSDSTVTADHWVNLDIPAALSEVRTRIAPRFLCLICHSIGGQLFGQSPARKEADGALFIAAQRGVPGLFRGIGALRVRYAYALFPLLIRMFGRLPVSRLTLPESCSGEVIRQWITWGKTGIFTDERGVNVEPRFEEYQGPLIAVTFSDDDYYAPASAVDALTDLYTGAAVRRVIIQPRDFDLKELGHFGFFHPRSSRKLWAQGEAWLRELEVSACAARNGTAQGCTQT